MQPDAFKTYLNAIGNYPLLTADQEIQLSRQIQRMLELKEADRELTPAETRQIKIGERAKEKLIKCNLKLVVHIAKRYARRLVSNNMEVLDLVQEGNMGLDRAVEKFDGARGYKFLISTKKNFEQRNIARLISLTRWLQKKTYTINI